MQSFHVGYMNKLPQMEVVYDETTLRKAPGQSNTTPHPRLDIVFLTDGSQRRDLRFLLPQNKDIPVAELLKTVSQHVSDALETKLDDKYKGSRQNPLGDKPYTSLYFENPVEIFLVATKLRDLFFSENEIFLVASDTFIQFEKMRLNAWRNAVAFAKAKLQESAEVEDLKNQQNDGESRKFKLEQEKQFCKKFLANHSDPVDFCADCLNTYVRVGEDTSPFVAMRCIKNLVNFDTEGSVVYNETFPFSVIQKAAEKKLHHKPEVSIGTGILELDRFEFLELPQVERRRLDSAASTKSNLNAKHFAQLDAKAEAKTTDDWSSSWSRFKSWIATKFVTAKPTVVAKSLYQSLYSSMFSTYEAQAAEGNLYAQYRYGLELKSTNRKKAEANFVQATLAPDASTKAAACYELAKLYVSDYFESKSEDAADVAAEWCKRAVLVDNGAGMKEFTDYLFKTHDKQHMYGTQDPVNSAAFLPNKSYDRRLRNVFDKMMTKSSLVRVEILRHQWQRFNAYEVQQFVNCSSDGLQRNHTWGNDQWGDEAACRAVEVLATLPGKDLERNFTHLEMKEDIGRFEADAYSLWHCFNSSSEACALILTKHKLMDIYLDQRCAGNNTTEIRNLLKSASDFILGVLMQNPKEIPPQLVAYLHYAKMEGMSPLLKCSMEYENIVRQISKIAETNTAYKILATELSQPTRVNTTARLR